MKLSLKGIVAVSLALGGCSLWAAAEPNTAVVTVNVLEASGCYTRAHSLDAGKEERLAVFDSCACEAGKCDQ